MKQEAKDLRDLARQLEDTARVHPAWSMVWQPVTTLIDHLSAMAGVIEARAQLEKIKPE